MTGEEPLAKDPAGLRIKQKLRPGIPQGGARGRSDCRGIYLNPIILVNMRGFYDPLLALLDRCIRERFMDRQHEAMWTVVSDVEEVIPAVLRAPKWTREARNFAAV
jgi:hypothetical protein